MPGAQSFPQAGFSSMMKNGAKHYSGLEEAVMRNIDACKELTEITRTSLGPFGMNKIIINHIEKLFVTNDAATIIKELEVQHPAAKLVVYASQQQQGELGDATNLVVILAGELLKQANELINLGLHPSEIIGGYQKSSEKAQEFLNELECYKMVNHLDQSEVEKCLMTTLSSKQYGLQDSLAPIISEACIHACGKLPHNKFSIDNIRVCKILGGSALDTKIINGMVFLRDVEGTIRSMTDCKIGVFACPLDISKTETKGTVLIKTGKELEEFSNKEEDIIEEQIRQIAHAGINVIVCGSTVHDLAKHFCEKFGILVMRTQSKFDLRRLCKSTGATALARLGAPMPEEMGFASKVRVDEIGGQNVVIFNQDKATPIATILVRGSTHSILDDIERAIDGAVNTYKQIGRDARFVAGGGATEIELAKKLNAFGETCEGLDQYAIKQFAKAFEVVPRTLAVNCGIDSSEFLSKLYASHESGSVYSGLNIEGDAENGHIMDCQAGNIIDLMVTKTWAIRLAAESACTVLSVDQIIMAKKAGGMAPKGRPNYDPED